jgi:hypothetical protein
VFPLSCVIPQITTNWRDHMTTRPKLRGAKHAAVRAIATAAMIAAAGGACAVQIEVDNPDIKLRWDNTLRYTLGTRVESQDPRILASPSYDESDAKFGKGSVVTNRLDLLSEFDLNYAGRFGARVSAAAWYDNAYDDHGVTTPAAGGVIPTSYFGNAYNDKVSRYVNGPSAEFLDAFAWSNFNLGEVPVNVKLGRHTVVWGEGLLIGGHAISYGQAPVDGVKAVTSPGIETKEVFLPLNQLSFKAQLTSNVSVMGQYFLEWKPTRVPNGGTYLMGADTSPNVDRLGFAAGLAANQVAALTPGNTGNWGLGLKWDVDAIASTLGFFYRKFNDYNPETGIQFTSFTQLVPGNAATTVPTAFRFVYPQDVKLIGASLARSIGPVSFGAEVSLRQNAHLNSKTTYGPTENTGARGDTLHMVANGVYLLPKTPVWDSGSLIVELAYSRLQKITANESLYRGEGYAGCIKSGTGSGGVPAAPGDRTDACSSKQFAQMAISFTPQYLQLFPSWDVTVPVAINYGLKGTAPTGGGGFEKLLTWSVGLGAVYATKHELSLRYSDISVPGKYNAAGTTLIGGNSLSSSLGATDRGWLVFTYKTSF